MADAAGDGLSSRWSAALPPGRQNESSQGTRRVAFGNGGAAALLGAILLENTE